MMDIYFQEKYVTIYVDRAQYLARAVWNGFLSSENYRSGSQICINLIYNQNISKWLADNRKMKAIRKQDQEWTVEHMVPKLARSPLRKMATIVSEDIFNQMAVESMFTRSSDLINFEHHYFKDEITALIWLKQTQPQVNYNKL